MVFLLTSTREIASDNTPPYVYHPCSLGQVVDQSLQTPWLPVPGPHSGCDGRLGQGAGYEYMDTASPWKSADGLWNLLVSIQGCEDRARGLPTNPSGNQGQALLFTSPALQGRNWTYKGVLFKTNETVIPGRTPWVDFIDADIFRGVPGAVSPSVTVFVNSWAGGPHSNAECHTEEGCWIWNQVQYWIGRTLRNGSFVAFTNADGRVNTGAVDYGNYGPSPITPNNSMGIDVAGLGGTQYYTCKTGQDLTGGYNVSGRRIMFAWLMEGLSGAFPKTRVSNISVRALPRDITLRVNGKGDHEMLQAPVSEL